MTPADTERPAAVVVGLDNITGLQTARILSERGVRVFGIVANPRHWAAHTNACVDIVAAPSFGDGLVQTLTSLAERLSTAAVLLPCTDQTVMTLSRHREELAPAFRLTLAPKDVLETMIDKRLFAEHARSVGLAVPRTEILSDRQEAERVSMRIDYPAVIKPPSKVESWLRHTSAKAIRVRNREELLATYDEVAEWAPGLLAQEWVEGGEDRLISCNCYFDASGRPLVTFVARKVRQWPPGVGTSSSGEECRDDEALELTLKLFGSVGFHGLGYLEMKRDDRTGRLVIIEPNVGRPTGRSAIAEAGGVELIFTAYCDAAGLPLPTEREQHYSGARWVDVRRDLQAALVARRDGRLTMSEWLSWMRGPKAHAIWSRHDVKPFAVDLVRATAVALRRHWPPPRHGRKNRPTGASVP
jgi:predicted ATP-grasp superfamily ATP-dependent carboligase